MGANNPFILIVLSLGLFLGLSLMKDRLYFWAVEVWEEIEFLFTKYAPSRASLAGHWASNAATDSMTVPSRALWETFEQLRLSKPADDPGKVVRRKSIRHTLILLELLAEPELAQTHSAAAPVAASQAVKS